MRIIQPSYYLKRAMQSNDITATLENLQYFNRHIATSVFDIGQKYHLAWQQYINKFAF